MTTGTTGLLIPVDAIRDSLRKHLPRIHSEPSGRRLIAEIQFLAWVLTEGRKEHYEALSLQGLTFDPAEKADGTLPQVIPLGEGNHGFHILASTYLGTDLNFYRLMDPENMVTRPLHLETIPVGVLAQLRNAMRPR